MKTKLFQWRWLLTVGLFISAPTLQADENGLYSPPHAEPEKQVSASQACVKPVPEMRREHMNLILHQRNQTMHHGVRTTDNSLQGCVNCHVTQDDAGEPIDFTNEKHFCNSCHQYVAVTIDCFQCHNSKPTEPVVKGGNQ